MKKKRIKILLVLSIVSILTLMNLILQKNSDSDYTFEKNGVMYALYVNGESVSEFPTFESKYDYGVTVSCTNANGYWDYESSLLRIEDIEENAGCDIYFSDLLDTAISDYVVSLAGNGQVVYENGVSSTYTTNSGTEDVYPGYRYEGADPDNYVWFNGELWRIIGAMDTLTAAGDVETLTKIIATDSIGGWSWNSANTNDWPNSSLYKILNSDYYGATDGSSASSYCYKYSTTIKGNCNFTETGISVSYRSMIENVVWSLGATSSSSLTADEFYTAERGTDVYTGRSTSTTGYIGLMYMSDYGYSAGSSCEATLGSYDSSVCAGDSWMYYGNYIWTIVPYCSSSSYAWYVGTAGYANHNSSNNAGGVVPVLYLKSNIEIVSGEGTASNPYILVAG